MHIRRVEIDPPAEMEDRGGAVISSSCVVTVDGSVAIDASRPPDGSTVAIGAG